MSAITIDRSVALQIYGALWFANASHWGGNKKIEEAIDLIQSVLEQPEQKPRREWRGLTEEELLPLLHSCDWRRMHLAVLCRAIEQALKEKNA